MRGDSVIDGASGTGYVTAKQYLRAVTRRWWVIGLALLVGGLGGTAYAGSVVKQYKSVVTVSVTPTGVTDVNAVTGTRTTTAINMDNEVQLVTSPTVATGASALLKSTEDPFALAKHVTVTVRPNTALMDISFKAAKPAVAQQGAHAFASAYLNQRRIHAQADLDDQVDGLESQIKTVSASLRTVTAQIASLPDNSPTKSYAAAQQTVLVSQLSSLQAKLAPLQITTVTPGDILADAQLPTTPSGLGRKVMLLGGLLIGLLMGFVLAAVAERVDPRVLHPDDLAGRLPVLAQFGRASRLRPGRVAPPGSRTALGFAHLRNRLVASSPDGLTVLVTAARQGDGTSVVAANLAVALARGGFDTVLLCLDPASPSLRALEATNTPSVGDVVRAELPADYPPVLPSLRVVSGGPDTPAELPTAGLTAFNQRLRGLAQYVVVESPSLATDGDAQAWAGLADAALVVVELRRTTSSSVLRAEALLEPVTRSVAGLVTVPRSRRHRGEARQDSVRDDDVMAPTPRTRDDGDNNVAHLHGAQ
jgi:capsular polysaccharide biosynthesis protein